MMGQSYGGVSVATMPPPRGIDLAGWQRVQGTFARLNIVVQTFSDAYDAIDLIPDSDETTDLLIDLWNGIEDIGTLQWQARAKLSHKLTARPALAGGRGKRDDEHAGVSAAVNWLAGKLGVSASTIWEDRRLYATFGPNYFNGQSSLLRDRGYFTAALRAHDPQGAIEAIGARTDEGITKVVDAKRIVNSLNVAHELESARDVAVARRYPVIYCAPDWERVGATINRTTISPYVTRECVVFLRSPSQWLQTAFTVLTGWGVLYSTTYVAPTLYGYPDTFFRQVHDVVLVAVRGSLASLVVQERMNSISGHQDHGTFEGTDVVYGVIERLFPHYPKLDVSGIGTGAAKAITTRENGWSYL